MKTALYIHVPFCRSKCSYCDFFSVAHQGSVPDTYIAALTAEMAWRKKQFQVNAVTTVYLGGGTPSLLSEVQLKKLFDAIHRLWPDSVPDEITVEANPADITESFLQGLTACGVNRLSVGIQSVDQQVLKTLNRRSDAACVSRCLELLNTSWKGRLSLDFISGLPGLSDEQFLAGLQLGTETGADHISLYALTLEEHTVLWDQVEQGRILLDDEQNDRQWALGCDWLTSHGYRQYEVSNFARPGYEARHNTTYWLMNPYLGIGAGGTGTVGCHRWTNTTAIHDYCAFWNGTEEMDGENAVPPEETELLDEETRQTEFLMMGFRLLDGVSEKEYHRRFGGSLAERLGELWNQWESCGRAHRIPQADGDITYALTEQGILLLNRFLLDLL
ncbi:MAG: radical SAM family heme chaperone HemW [Treponemataceae bacterium]|nr:radical SAM family heme chaperone HemW [Treponemataceae bacterium]